MDALLVVWMVCILVAAKVEQKAALKAACSASRLVAWKEFQKVVQMVDSKDEMMAVKTD